MKNVVLYLKSMITDESKEAAFRRLASKRLNKAVKCIRLIGNLSNKNNYRYGKTDIKVIFSAIDKELRMSKMKFSMNLENNDEIKL